jgi:hypothetical protein
MFWFNIIKKPNQTLKSDSAILSPFAQKYAQKSPTLLRRLAWRYTVKTKKYQLGFSGLSGSIS